MERLSRRKIIIGVTAVTADILVEHLVSSAHYETSSGPPIIEGPLYSTLADYQKAIADEKAVLRKAVKEHDLFGDFRRLTKEQRLADFDLYFDLYKAAELKYGIPVEMLYATHVQETSVSRDDDRPNLTYRGAMQRDPNFYSDQIAAAAAKGWEFLKDLPQRHPSDYQEIMFAAWKMRQDADRIKQNSPWITFEESIMAAQYSYCAGWVASSRNTQYQKIRWLFGQALKSRPDRSIPKPTPKAI